MKRMRHLPVGCLLAALAIPCVQTRAEEIEYVQTRAEDIEPNPDVPTLAPSELVAPDVALGDVSCLPPPDLVGPDVPPFTAPPPGAVPILPPSEPFPPVPAPFGPTWPPSNALFPPLPAPFGPNSARPGFGILGRRMRATASRILLGVPPQQGLGPYYGGAWYRPYGYYANRPF